jgi:hypothetical protein
MAERILVCGDREWANGRMIYDMLSYVKDKRGIEVIIEGEAKGADKLGRMAALALGITEDKILKFPAEWTKYNRAAGPIRNAQMLKEGKPTLVLAFHDNIDKSKGTKDMVTKAKRAGVKYILCYHPSAKSAESVLRGD